MVSVQRGVLRDVLDGARKLLERALMSSWSAGNGHSMLQRSKLCGGGGRVLGVRQRDCCYGQDVVGQS
jgi:hypothetical protein